MPEARGCVSFLPLALAFLFFSFLSPAHETGDLLLIPAGSVPSRRKMKVGDFTFYCTYSPGLSPRYSQFILIVESK